MFPSKILRPLSDRVVSFLPLLMNFSSLVLQIHSLSWLLAPSPATWKTLHASVRLSSSEAELPDSGRVFGIRVEAEGKQLGRRYL